MKKDKNNKTFSDRFDEMLIDVEKEYQMGGLSSGLYADYAKEVSKRFFISELKSITDEIEEIKQRLEGLKKETEIEESIAIGLVEGLNEAQQIIKKRI